MPALLGLAARYCAADAHDFDEARVSNALTTLLDDEGLGRVLVLDDGGVLRGYAVLTWGFSLESGGVEALLDELYAEPQGRGLGGLLLDAVVAAAARHGARRLFLETEPANVRARGFYARHGFVTEPSVWMSADVSPGPRRASPAAG